MVLQVYTAVTGATWESELVRALDRSDHGVAVVRRCVDVAELLAAAATGTGQAALLSGDLRRLDVDAVARLEAAGVAVVGLVEPADDGGADRLQRLGVRSVLPADAPPELVAQALREAVSLLSLPGRDVADPAASLPPVGGSGGREEPPAGAGRVVAVWGPTGAPGRTTVAVGIADEAARLGVPTLLVDADVYGGVVAQVLGLLDESPGLAGAARQAARGSLDGEGLLRLSWTVRPQLRVLTGLARPDRWPELRPRAVEAVLDEARRLADLAVADAPTTSPAAADVTRMSRQTIEGIAAWHDHRMPALVPEVVDLAATVDHDWLAVLAQAHAQAGRRTEALAAVDRMLTGPGEGTREPVHTVLLSDVYLELGAAERAESLLPALESYGDTVVVLWPGTTVLGPSALYRGGIKALLGRRDAADDLHRAVQICDAFGFAPFRRRAERLLAGR